MSENLGQAAGVLEARLGRAPRDVIEATVVLEAWAGLPAGNAMAAARTLIQTDTATASVPGRIDAVDPAHRQSVALESLALILSILSVAAWATPLSRAFGAQTLAEAIRIALPVAVAVQWALRSRYLSLSSGMALLAGDGLAVVALAFLGVVAPLLLIPGCGRIAAILVAIWVGGAVVTRRGWGLLYSLALTGAAVALDDGVDAVLVLLLLTAGVLAATFAGVISSRAETDERPGGVSRTTLAALLGACVGVLLMADPSLGWGVRGLHPAISLVPSVAGSLWGGYHLWNLYEAVPQGLSGVAPLRASRRTMRGPAMALFLGAAARLVVATVVLSAVVIALGRWTHGTDRPSVFIAFGCVALVSLQVSLLEALGRQRAALMAIAAALTVELAWPHLVGSGISGGALAAGAIVGILLTLPPLITLLSRAGRVLATALWIH
ncbi:MAG TPA: hypothetical protein VGL69_23065 [Solirubrobacteraceae bacterium]|jgi:hypothetical protein